MYKASSEKSLEISDVLITSRLTFVILLRRLCRQNNQLPVNNNNDRKPGRFIKLKIY